MHGKWFSNRGQAIQLAIAGCSLVLALVNAAPYLSSYNLLALSPVVLYFVTVLFIVSLIAFYSQAGNRASETPPLGTESSILRRPRTSLTRVVCGAGDYWEPEDTDLRISVDRIRVNEQNDLGVELHFMNVIGVFGGGRSVDSMDRFRFFVRPVSSSGIPQDSSVYKIILTKEFADILIVVVDHINQVAGQVTLLVYRISDHSFTIAEAKV